MKLKYIFLRFNFLKISVCVMIFMFITDTLLADKTDSLFQSDEIINIELRSDFTAIQVDRIENPQYHEGELIYHAPEGKTITFSVKVRARGNFRRDPKNCSFPPLAVVFKRSEVNNTLFENQHKLKLVTPCQNDKDVIKEYLIYKLYNKVTDRSLKARLIKILYFDTGSGKKLFEKYSFFLEDDEQVAEQNDSFEIDNILTPYDLERDAFIKMAVFEYMIGNKDWFITSKRNIVVMQPKDTTLAPFAVPYDFDFAAFVNAEYTKPPDVPDEFLAPRRIYKGICCTTAEYNEVFAFYKSLRPVFESIIDNMTLLSKAGRVQNLSYLNSFYKIIESKEMIKKEFLDKCETRKAYNLPEN